MQSIRPTELVIQLKQNFAVDLPSMVWGPPGIGKSDIVKQMADEMGCKRIDFRANLMEPVDLRGVPFVTDDYRTSWAIPDIFPRADRDGEVGILNIEELPTAMPSTQTTLYQLALDRKIDQYTMPDGWGIIATGNKQEDRAATYAMPTPLKNRFAHYQLEVNLDDWVRWANKKGIHPLIISFLRFKAELLHNFDPDVEAFPTPRTWEFLDRRIKNETDTSSTARWYAACSLVGEGAASEFRSFCDIHLALPNMDELIKNPKTTPVPDEPSVCYAISGSLAAKANKKNFEAILIYAARLSPEYQVILVRDAVQRDEELTTSEPFVKWATENADIVI